MNFLIRSNAAACRRRERRADAIAPPPPLQNIELDLNATDMTFGMTPAVPVAFFGQLVSAGFGTDVHNKSKLGHDIMEPLKQVELTK